LHVFHLTAEVLTECPNRFLGDSDGATAPFRFRFTEQDASTAKTLVMSLWKVPDEITQKLMVKFYRHIQAGQSCAAALREAQLAIKSEHPDPFRGRANRLATFRT
jgi:hypothetical protein